MIINYNHVVYKLCYLLFYMYWLMLGVFELH